MKKGFILAVLLYAMQLFAGHMRADTLWINHALKMREFGDKIQIVMIDTTDSLFDTTSITYDPGTGYLYLPAYLAWDTTIAIGGILKYGSAKTVFISVGSTPDADSGAWIQLFGENNAITGNIHMQTGYTGVFNLFTQLALHFIWDEDASDGDDFVIKPRTGGGTDIGDNDATGELFIHSNNGTGVNGLDYNKILLKLLEY